MEAGRRVGTGSKLRCLNVSVCKRYLSTHSYYYIVTHSFTGSEDWRAKEAGGVYFSVQRSGGDASSRKDKRTTD